MGPCGEAAYGLHASSVVGPLDQRHRIIVPEVIEIPQRRPTNKGQREHPTALGKSGGPVKGAVEPFGSNPG